MIAFESMTGKRLRIYLLPGPDESPLESAEYQADLDTFDKIVRSHGIVPQRKLKDLKAAAGGVGFLRCETLRYLLRTARTGPVNFKIRGSPDEG